MLVNKTIKGWVKENSSLFDFSGSAKKYAEWVSEQPSGKYLNVNLYAFGLLSQYRHIREIYSKSRHIGIDGFGASILLFLILGKWKRAVGYKEWGEQYLNIMSNEKVMFIGGTKDESLKAKRVLERTVGMKNELLFVNGYEKKSEIIKALLSFEPTVCFVGVGMGKQELVIDDLEREWSCAKYFSCGGWIKQLGGLEKNCPAWLSRAGFEWCWRSFNKKGHIRERVIVPIKNIMS